MIKSVRRRRKELQGSVDVLFIIHVWKITY